MTRVLLVGMSPLPTENTTKSYAAGLRTWQFARALVDAGHEVILVCCRIPFVYEKALAPPVESRDPHLGVIRIDADELDLVQGDFLARLLASYQPDCIVGAHTFPSSIAAGLNTDKPLWADLNGHLMAEAQVKASTYENDFYIDHFWRMEQTILDRADIFSVVSRAQGHATLGELGTRRRLGRHTVGYDFIRHIPDVCPPPTSIAGGPRIRGQFVPEDAFVVLWSGAYNTWTDVETLFAGLEQAMSLVQNLYFVSTGGQVDGHDDLTYPRFQRLIERSRFRDRFVMRGWLPAVEVPAYQAAADVAINLDGRNLEAEFGTRTRMLAWAMAGLPIVSTVVCELAHELNDRQLLYGFEVGQPASLARTLAHAAADALERERRAQGVRDFVSERYEWKYATAPLVEWCRNPSGAPDRHHRLPPNNRSDTTTPAAAAVTAPLTSPDPPVPANNITLLEVAFLGFRETWVHWKNGGPRAVASRYSRFWKHERHVLRRLL